MAEEDGGLVSVQARAARIYGQVLDRLEAALEQIAVGDAGEHLAELVQVLRGCELAIRHLGKREAGGGDVAETRAELVLRFEGELGDEGDG